MALDLSFIDQARALEVEAVDEGRSTSEFALAPGRVSEYGPVGEGEEEALYGRPVDDIIEIDERLRDLPPYVELAKHAFQQRGLMYPFEIDDSRQSLFASPGSESMAIKVAELSRVVRLGNPEASRFEKRAFRALHKLLGGWGVCVGAPRSSLGMGAEKAIRHYRTLLFPHEQAGHWPADFSPNGDHGSDGFLILGRQWGGPVAFYQSKNTGFDLESHPEEFSRIPAIAQDWFGKRMNVSRQIIRVLALNTVLTIELKERIYAERGEMNGVHVVDAVDILATENAPAGHIASRQDCIVL